MSRIEAGMMAPSFAAQTYDDKELSLDSYRGAKLWLSFYRWASCPLCNYRIQELIARHEEFSSAGIRVLGVMQSPAENIRKHTVRQDQPFPLVSDPDLELYGLYGVKPNFWSLFHPRNVTTAIKSLASGAARFGLPDGPLSMVPADFLVDPEGVVWEAYYGKALSDHIPFERVAAFAADDCLRVA